MSVLYVLVPVALILVGAALGAFIWSVRRGQFDDLATPAIRAVVDDVELETHATSRQTPGRVGSLAPENKGIAGQK